MSLYLLESAHVLGESLHRGFKFANLPAKEAAKLLQGRKHPEPSPRTTQLLPVLEGEEIWLPSVEKPGHSYLTLLSALIPRTPASAKTIPCTSLPLCLRVPQHSAPQVTFQQPDQPFPDLSPEERGCFRCLAGPGTGVYPLMELALGT